MIRRPTWLHDEDAIQFWNENKQHLIDSDMLTEKDVPAFCQLCTVFGLMQKCDSTSNSKEALRFNGLQKLFQSYLKEFGMLAKSRKVSKLETEVDPDALMERRIQDAKKTSAC